MEQVSGKVVLITGASSGIGKATAEAFANAGARVALLARRTDVLESLAAKLRATGADALAVPADLGDGETTRAAVAKAGIKMPLRPTWDQVGQIAARIHGSKKGLAGIALRGVPGWVG